MDTPKSTTSEQLGEKHNTPISDRNLTQPPTTTLPSMAISFINSIGPSEVIASAEESTLVPISAKIPPSRLRDFAADGAVDIVVAWPQALSIPDQNDVVN